jgi:NADPH:quinone reductase-like Zn-dependent oxidoreductase
LEIGPAPVLVGLARQCLPDAAALWLPSLRKDGDARETALGSLGALFTAGAALDWHALARATGLPRTTLPSYPFQRKRFWLKPSATPPPSAARASASGGHPFAVRRIEAPLRETLFECDVDVATCPLLAEHRVAGLTIVPAAAYLELAHAVASKYFESSAVAVSDLTFRVALILDEQVARDVRVVVTPRESGAAGFEIVSRLRKPNEGWIVHASGAVSRGGAAGTYADASTARRTCTKVVDMAAYQQRMADAGLDYGPSFRALVAAHAADDAAYGELALPAGDTWAGRFGAHPGMVDAAFHLLGIALGGSAVDRFYLPVHVEAAEFLEPLGASGTAHVSLTARDASRVVADVTLWRADGHAAGRVRGLQVRALTPAQFRAAVGTSEAAGPNLLMLAWRAIDPSSESSDVRAWRVLGGNPELSRLVVEGLRRTGCDVEARADHRETGSAAFTGGLVDLRPTTLAEDALRGAPSTLARGSALDAMLSLLHDAAAGTCAATRIVIVTRGAQGLESDDEVAPLGAACWGLGITAAAELPAADVRLVDLGLRVGAGASGRDTADAAALVAAALRGDREARIAVRGDRAHGARLVRVGAVGTDRLAVPDGPYELVMRERGTLAGLGVEPRVRRTPGPHQVEIETLASGLNFRDVLNLLDMYPGPAGPLGNECCGRIVAVGAEVAGLAVGDLVTCIAEATFGSHVIAEAALTFRVPAELSIAQAAVFPIAQLTAYVALHRVGRVGAGARVLIHAAAGGVGLAAVHLALAAGAEVYATAGSAVKRDELLRLGVRAVFDSRSPLHAAVLRDATGGRGVDIVLNSLTGDFIDEGLRSLAQGGRFVEIGLRDVRTPEQVRTLREDIEYHTLLLGALCRDDPPSVRAMFAELVALLAAGRIPAPVARSFPFAHSSAAFRFMAQARHVGRIAIVHPTFGRAAVRADASYLVTGGFGALGMHIATWLADRGARRIILCGRKPPAASVAAEIQALAARGIAIECRTGDVAEARDAVSVTSDAGGPPLRGIVHAAGVVEDSSLANADSDRLMRALRPKADGMLNLVRATERADLDFFAVFSSGSAVLGSPGQAVYAAANAYMDALAERLERGGRRVVSIGWGAWESGGMATRVSDKVARDWAARGIGRLSAGAAVDALERALAAERAYVAVLPVDWPRFFSSTDRWPAVLDELAPRTAAAAGALSTSAGSLRAELRSLNHKDGLHSLVSALRTETAAVLGTDAAELDPNLGLAEQGMDSLMAVELRNRIEKQTGVLVTASRFLTGITLAGLAEELAATHAPREAEARTQVTEGEI